MHQTQVLSGEAACWDFTFELWIELFLICNAQKGDVWCVAVCGTTLIPNHQNSKDLCCFIDTTRMRLYGSCNANKRKTAVFLVQVVCLERKIKISDSRFANQFSRVHSSCNCAYFLNKWFSAVILVEEDALKVVEFRMEHKYHRAQHYRRDNIAAGYLGLHHIGHFKVAEL